jgi:hypothetical protein
MKGFLAQAAEYVNGNHPDGLQDVLLCFPNNRAGYFFAEEIRAIYSEAVWMPEITTFEKWIYSMSDSAVAQRVELIDLLYKTYTEVGGEDSFEIFISTAQMMLADFDELDKQLVNPEKLFKDLYDIKSMNTFLEDETTLTDYSRNYTEFWNVFRDCYFKFSELLKAERKAYDGMIYRQVAEQLSAHKFDNYSKIYFIGFSGLAKSEQEIVAYLLETELAEFLIDADTYYLKNTRQEAGDFFREYKKNWRIKTFNWESSFMLQVPKKIEVIGVARSIGQAKLTGDILQNHLKVTTENLSDTVIVLPDEKLLQPLISELPDSVSHVNITMGLPLGYMQLADLVRHIGDMQNNAGVSVSSGRQRFYHRDVITILQHSYFRLLIKDAAVIPDVIRTIRITNKVTVTKEELLEWFKADKELVSTFFQKSETVSQYLAHLLSITDLMMQRFALLDLNDNETDKEVLHWLKKVLANLHSQLGVFEQVWDIKSIQKLIESEMRATRLPFESDKTDGLQVMGMMETRALDFKNVVILSMNESVFPSGKGFNSFFPYDLRKAYGMTTHRDRDAVAAYLFYRLIQRAENVYLIYNTESDLLGGGEKSRFILQLQHELSGQANIEIRESNFVLGADVAQAEQGIDVEKNEGVRALLKAFLAEKGLSPTALNSYVNCSLQFYFKYILSLREEEDVEEDMEASTIGSAVHHALEKVFGGVLGKQLTSSYLTRAIAASDRIGVLIKEYLSERFDEESLAQGKNYLLYTVCKSLVINFLKNEMKRVEELEAQGKTVTITLLEHKLAQKMQINDYDVTVHGVTDRVELVDGVPGMADYKTGDSKKGKVKIDDLALLKSSPEYSKALQLMIYALLYRSEFGRQTKGIRSGIYWLRHAEGKYESLAKDKSDLIGDGTLDSFELLLKEIIGELVDEHIPFRKTEDKDRCGFCDFKRICGRD